MPRTRRFAPGGVAFPVPHRGVGRRTIFETDKDYAAFVGIVRESLRTAPMRICAFCLMPNHWHLLLWPERDGQLPAFVQKFSNTHVQRWQQTAKRLGLESTLRTRGRPKKGGYLSK